MMDFPTTFPVSSSLKRLIARKPVFARKEAGVLNYATVRELALALPGVEEGTCYGTPALRVKGKLLTRLWEDGETLVVHVDLYERDGLVARDPETYFVTDHYRSSSMVLVRLGSVEPAQMEELLEKAWALRAPKRLVAARS